MTDLWGFLPNLSVPSKMGRGKITEGQSALRLANEINELETVGLKQMVVG